MPPDALFAQTTDTCVLTQAQTYSPPFPAILPVVHAAFVAYYSRDKTVLESHQTSREL